MAKEFKTIEEAVKANEALASQLKAEQYAHAKTKVSVGDLNKGLKAEQDAHAKTKEALADAEQLANEAFDEANSALESKEGVFVTLYKVKYKVNFGVDGLSKEELKGDKALLGKLIKNGSMALSIVN